MRQRGKVLDYADVQKAPGVPGDMRVAQSTAYSQSLWGKAA
jgi:hypothetical protein